MAAKLTPAACRAARGILKWSVRDLGREAGISPTTVNLLEADRPYRAGTAEKIVQAFAEHDVEITNGDGTGARLRIGRSELHSRFCAIVDEVAFRRAPEAMVQAICRLIMKDARVSQDLLPGDTSREIGDLDDKRPPNTYGAGARRLLAILKAGA